MNYNSTIFIYLNITEHYYTIMSTSLEVESDCKSEDDCKIIPPEKCLMPESLMAYYNCYQRLDIPPCVLGRPHLIHSISMKDKM